MSNEDIIKTWVQDRLKETYSGYSIKQGNLSKEGAREWMPALYEAMIHASKSQNNERGSADFTYIAHGLEENQDYLIIIETKPDVSNLINIQDGRLLMDPKSTKEYAVNGAVWYGKSIQKETQAFPRIFALGVAGNYTRQKISAYYVNETGGIIDVPDTEAFAEFSDSQIDEYYRVNVQHKTPKSELRAEQLADYSEKLHNDIRSYTSLKSEEKAPLVAAILLAIHSKNLSLNMLNGSLSYHNNDGVLIFNAIQDYLDQRKREEPDFNDEKIGVIMSEFAFIKTTKPLYTPVNDLGNHSPLYQFTSELFQVYQSVKIGDDADLLGDFYSEFVKYGGTDGSVLGIVLTPKHITGLMSDLIEVGKDDYLLDPTTGSAAFLVAGMNRMIKQIPKDENYERTFRDIVANRLHGVEMQRSIYSVASSNMILRGDGKSNLSYGKFQDFKLKSQITGQEPQGTMYARADSFTKVLMNPPYSQGKKAPEIMFIKHALELMSKGGKLAVIVPISVFVSGGKEVTATKFKEFKEWLLNNHTVEAIITMNLQTFYPTATQTVIAIIRAWEPQEKKKTKLVNFIDDGYSVVPKKGLIPNGSQSAKRQKLIDVVVNGDTATPDFMMPIQLTVDNEWVHNAHYTNPDKPSDADFLQAVADFVAFKQDMILHGKDYLFNDQSK